MSRHRPLILVMAVLTWAPALTGCGDGEERPATTPEPTEEPARTATPAPESTPTPAPESTPEEPEAEAQDCGQVAYAPQTDHGAFDIRAEGVGCDIARKVAEAAEGESSSFRAEGFDCAGEHDPSLALPSTRWACEAAGASITFSTS